MSRILLVAVKLVPLRMLEILRRRHFHCAFVVAGRMKTGQAPCHYNTLSPFYHWPTEPRGGASILFGLGFFSRDFLLRGIEDDSFTRSEAGEKKVRITAYGQILYGSVFAGSSLGTLPLLVIFLIFQKQFISGTLAGSIKG